MYEKEGARPLRKKKILTEWQKRIELFLISDFNY